MTIVIKRIIEKKKEVYRYFLKLLKICKGSDKKFLKDEEIFHN